MLLSIISPRRTATVLTVIALATKTMAQSAGPNDPATAGNDASIGTTDWATPGNIATSNDTYATVANKGVSHYLTANSFGFSIPSPAGIVGIQLDVERNTNASQDVALLDAWSAGLVKSVSAGTNRCLLVAYAQENGTGSRDITAMTYGGRTMTQVAEQAAGASGGFNARVEVWALLEPELAMAVGTAIVPTYGTYAPFEFCEAFSSATFQHVDQLGLVSNQQATGSATGSNPHQLATPLVVLAGSMAVNIVTSGNNTTPAIGDGGTNTYTINNGFTEGTDLYFANTSVAPTSGACLQTAHKAITANGTEQPACTFNGSVNRWMMVGLTLQRARELDYRVQLVKGGIIGGSDRAGVAAWPLTDAYATYGGPSDLWGQSWNVWDINTAEFGAAMATFVQNGTARIDHMRITIYYYSTLPVELLGFRALPDGDKVRLDWATASEQNNHHFVVQRSRDMSTFEDVAQVAAVGNSQITLFYGMEDEHPFAGTSYYRLLQVDTDGTSELSSIVAVTMEAGAQAIYPNPTSDGTLTVYDPAAQQLGVGVYDNEMRLLKRSTMNSGSAVDLLGELADGTYTIMVNNGVEVKTSRVVKTSRER